MRNKPTGPTVHNKMIVMLLDNDLKPALSEAAWIQCSQEMWLVPSMLALLNLQPSLLKSSRGPQYQ